MIDRRRAVILIAALGALVVPLVTDAQQAGKIPLIGVTAGGFAQNSYTDALRRGLADLGWVEGRNIRIEYRYIEGRRERIPALLAELIALKVDLIVAGGGAIRLATQATSTIPLVFPASYDPVAAGFVSSLARPGGNVTGQAQADIETTAKRMEFLKALLPKLARVAVLRDPGPVQAHADAMESTARSLGFALHTVTVSRPEELDAAFAAFKAARAEALIPTASAVYTAHRQRVVDLAAQHRLVAIYEHRAFVQVGGLISYGPNFEELWRGAARYVDRILKGAKPADLPVEQPTKFDLVVNLKTAKALGLVVPPSLLLRADHVID